MAQQSWKSGNNDARIKRSAAIALVTMGFGTFALCSMINKDECRQQNPDNPDRCNSSGRSSSHSSSSSSSSRSSGWGSGAGVTQTATRGGFGSSGRSFFSGFGG